MLIIAFYWPIGKKEVCGWRIVSSWLKSWSFVWNFRFGLSLSRGHIYCASLCTLGLLQTLEEIIELLPFRQVVAVQPIGRNQKMPNYLEFCGFKKCDQRSIFWQFRIASVSFLFSFLFLFFILALIGIGLKTWNSSNSFCYICLEEWNSFLLMEWNLGCNKIWRC